MNNLMRLGLSLAAGVNKPRVLYCNFELLRRTAKARLRELVAEMKISN